MRTAMTRALGIASRLTALAACGTTPTTPSTRPPPDAAAVAAHGDCGPCCDSDPAAEAGATQGIAQANPQFGGGGGTQYYISTKDAHKLRPGDSVPITRWGLAGTAGP